MGSLKRKISRKKKRSAEKQMKKQLNMFDKLESECSACTKPFDKKLKEHVQEWRVVVREKEQIVRLYCPSCWEKAIDLIKQVEEGQDDN
tara:strand:- start:2216 stop:2482 length:267 start_codon:yes stop_codon:yes gene_type:complete